jgi:glycosyltransferase involved in cell wall biosynthesis
MGFKVIRLDKNYGKGKACKVGTKNSKSDICIFIDGDDQFDPRDIESLEKAIAGADIVIGQRYIEKIPVRRQITNRLARYAVKKITGKRFDDVLCGLRAVRKDRLNVEELRDGYEFESDMIIKAVRNNLNIKTIHVNVSYKTGSRMPFIKGLKLSIYLFSEALKIW